MNKAQKLLNQFDPKGFSNTNDKGQTIHDLITLDGASYENNGKGFWRAKLSDGSVVTGFGDSWDIEGEFLYSWGRFEE